jgi:hypothetical protein
MTYPRFMSLTCTLQSRWWSPLDFIISWAIWTIRFLCKPGVTPNLDRHTKDTTHGLVQKAQIDNSLPYHEITSPYPMAYIVDSQESIHLSFKRSNYAFAPFFTLFFLIISYSYIQLNEIDVPLYFMAYNLESNKWYSSIIYGLSLITKITLRG